MRRIALAIAALGVVLLVGTAMGASANFELRSFFAFALFEIVIGIGLFALSFTGFGGSLARFFRTWSFAESFSRDGAEDLSLQSRRAKQESR